MTPRSTVFIGVLALAGTASQCFAQAPDSARRAESAAAPRAIGGWKTARDQQGAADVSQSASLPQPSGSRVARSNLRSPAATAAPEAVFDDKLRAASQNGNEQTGPVIRSEVVAATSEGAASSGSGHPRILPTPAGESAAVSSVTSEGCSGCGWHGGAGCAECSSCSSCSGCDRCKSHHLRLPIISKLWRHLRHHHHHDCNCGRVLTDGEVVATSDGKHGLHLPKLAFWRHDDANDPTDCKECREAEPKRRLFAWKDREPKEQIVHGPVLRESDIEPRRPLLSRIFERQPKSIDAPRSRVELPEPALPREKPFDIGRWKMSAPKPIAEPSERRREPVSLAQKIVPPRLPDPPAAPPPPRRSSVSTVAARDLPRDFKMPEPRYTVPARPRVTDPPPVAKPRPRPVADPPVRVAQRASEPPRVPQPAPEPTPVRQPVARVSEPPPTRPTPTRPVVTQASAVTTPEPQRPRTPTPVTLRAVAPLASRPANPCDTGGYSPPVATQQTARPCYVPPPCASVPPCAPTPTPPCAPLPRPCELYPYPLW